MLRPGLRGRFLLASLGLACVLIGGFTLALQQFIEAIENELSIPEFRQEFVRYVDVWQRSPNALPPPPMGYRLYLVNRDTVRDLPAALAGLARGIHEEIALGGLVYTVGREDRGADSLMLLRDGRFDPVERLEQMLGEIALSALLAASLLAAGVALWLSSLVVRPVERLAADLSEIVPGQRRERRIDVLDDPAIGLIARAFDQTLVRYDELVARERAFARDASHELRTPLSIVLTGAELLGPAVAGDPTLATRVGRIRAAAEQMEALTEGLLFLARPHASPAPPSYSASEVVEAAVRIQALALGANPQVRVRVGGGGPTLAVHRGLALCVINNLLRNAIEHGGAPIDIVLSPESLSIADAGPGVDGATLEAMFEAHVRGAGSTGHGLGLNIVRRICERLEWKLDAWSDGVNGTRITLHFPPVARNVPTATEQTPSRRHSS